MTCQICYGTGRIETRQTDGKGGFTFIGSACPECVEYQVCPKCDRDMMMEYGALLICVHCGFTYEGDERIPPEGEEQSTANAG